MAQLLQLHHARTRTARHHAAKGTTTLAAPSTKAALGTGAGDFNQTLEALTTHAAKTTAASPSPAAPNKEAGATPTPATDAATPDAAAHKPAADPAGQAMAATDATANDPAHAPGDKAAAGPVPLDPQLAQTLAAYVNHPADTAAPEAATAPHPAPVPGALPAPVPAAKADPAPGDGSKPAAPAAKKGLALFDGTKAKAGASLAAGAAVDTADASDAPDTPDQTTSNNSPNGSDAGPHGTKFQWGQDAADFAAPAAPAGTTGTTSPASPPAVATLAAPNTPPGVPAMVPPLTLKSATSAPTTAATPLPTIVTGAPPPATASATVAPAAQQSPAATDQNILDQVVVGLRGKFDAQNGKAEILLQPPNFGTLRVSISLTQGTLSAQFETSTDLARNLLSNHIDKLRSVLEGQGIAVDHLAVQTAAAPTAPAPAPDQRPTGSFNHDGRSAGGYEQNRQGTPRGPEERNSFARMVRQAQDNAPIDVLA